LASSWGIAAEEWTPCSLTDLNFLATLLSTLPVSPSSLRTSCTGGHSPGPQNGSRSKPHREENSGRTQRSSASHVFTQEEDDLIMALKETECLPWPETHKRFSKEFPQRRSQASLQVRYSTKLKTGSKRATRTSSRS
jgi:hypothetical protein